MVIYIDVLFIVNLIINYFILLSVAHLLKMQPQRLRILIGAAIGALYSCLIFFPKLEFLSVAILKLVLSVTIVAAAYKVHGIRNFLKLIAYFYIISTLFGGIIFALQQFFAPPALLIKNGVPYLDISPLFLILTSAGCYVVITIFSRMLHKKTLSECLYTIKVEVGEKSVLINAFLDTGNDLKDAVSGLPVIVAEYKRLEKLIPKEIRYIFKNSAIADVQKIEFTDFRSRFRVIPFGSVGDAGGLLPAFKPDKVSVVGENAETSEVIIAVTSKKLSSDESYSALLSPLIIDPGVLSVKTHDDTLNVFTNKIKTCLKRR